MKFVYNGRNYEAVFELVYQGEKHSVIKVTEFRYQGILLTNFRFETMRDNEKVILHQNEEAIVRQSGNSIDAMVWEKIASRYHRMYSEEGEFELNIVIVTPKELFV